ncbi:SLIT-ROBO Rho GTPase-activating protein 1-like isoform X4 [Zootermopsis nevadensis]|uniref:SLIT-ROBO Rho GTPase-activating protein 1-like isoform X4 n=1 Tax=Zootermopsis nevadensis TaxID=136037 RepID=UPI000B8E4F9D|nr:SLIT-ROBO Rho GTPase-activating protein 1-like isoform X4 [Zootermopsis nevadensis]
MALAIMVAFGSGGASDDRSKDIRLQLTEQLRCLDMRMESQVAVVAELQDYFRRRAEVEMDYSKNLDKLAKSLQLRHKEQKQKREQWPLFSTYSCWQQLVSQTKNLSKDHAALSEVYSTHLVGRLAEVMEDVQRIYRRCREIGYETHEEILRVLHELHTTMKTYHSYQGEYRQAENKLRIAENQRLKLEQSLPREKLDRSKKYRLIEKEVQKRKNKYNDAKLKALKARNEYVLCLEAANTTIHKYFVDDLSDLIDCMDFGFHLCMSRALLMHMSAEEARKISVQAGMEQMYSCINSLDSRLDKQRFLESNHTAFMIPKKFEFQGQRDEGPEPELQKTLRDELEARLTQLQNRVTSLRTESEEVWKTLETAETTLLKMLNSKDFYCNGYFGEGAVPVQKPLETVSIKLRADRQETEEFYLTKFREYILGTSRIARLDAKQEHIRQTLLDAAGDSPTSLKGLQQLHTGQTTKPPRRKRIGRLQMNGQPKLFGGSLEEYLETTNQEIPLIMKSCIRVINLYGLHHQGIFRVSGSQVEINNFRESFERGEDPLADVTDASDINSVAGVLKLYLRELREPLFPIIYFEHFMELAQLESKHDFVVKMRDLVQSLPRSVVIVMRYLFAFLNHLSEFSDENMMDPYNLAICFGPTLVPVPEDKDQVQYQNQVNELIKNIILFNEEIFPIDGGLLYEKYISREPDENDVGDSPSDHVQEDMDSEVYPSEDESECLEATAQFDFMARSERELSFKKGDNVILFSQVSGDWWRGSVNGQEGLIPDKYIMLKIKDEDRDKHELLKSSSSEESMRRRASSSNDSILSSGTSVSAHNSPLTGVSSATWPDPELTRRGVVAEPTSLIALPTQESDASPSPRLALRHITTSSSSTECVPSGLHLKTDEAVPASLPASRIIPGGSVMGAVEAALTTAQILATAALQAEAEGTEPDDDRLSEFLDSLPADGTKETGEDGSRPTTPVSSSSDGDRGDAEKRKDNSSNGKKTHWKSQSVGEVVDVRRSSGGEEGSVENANFSQNRELWQRRAASQSQLESSKSIVKSFRSNQEFWEMRQKHTPDLVMDLPLLGSSSPKEAGGSKKSLSAVSLSSLSSSSSSGEEENLTAETVISPTGPESPDMTTAAERFAKQNQCTLKKNTKASHGASIDAQTQTMKAATKRSKFAASSAVAATEMPDNDLQIPADVIKTSDNDNLKPSSDTKNQSTESELVPIRSPGPQRTAKIGGGKFGQSGPLLQVAAVSSFKPQVKVKPQILRKPVLPVPHPHHTQPSPELVHKEKTQEQMN